MIAYRFNEDLGLVFQAAEGFAVEDSVSVSLVAGPDRVVGFRAHPPFALDRFRRDWRKGFQFALLDHLADVCLHLQG